MDDQAKVTITDTLGSYTIPKDWARFTDQFYQDRLAFTERFGIGRLDDWRPRYRHEERDESGRLLWIDEASQISNSELQMLLDQANAVVDSSRLITTVARKRRIQQ